MDEGLVNEEAPVDAAEGVNLQNKESEFPLKLESNNMLESQERVIAEGKAPASSFQILADMLEGKNVNRIGNPVDPSDHPCISPQNVGNTDVMVEELTVQKYNSSSLPVVGTSNNRKSMPIRRNTWQHRLKLRGGSGSGSSHDDKESEKTKSNGGNNERNEALEQRTNAENNSDLANSLSNGSIRTKILSNSGFSEFFVKTTLKGKGIVCRGRPHDALKFASRSLNDTTEPVGPMMPLKGDGAIASNIPAEVIGGNLVDSGASQDLCAKNGVPSSNDMDRPRTRSFDCGVILRAWLKSKCHKVNKVEGLCIFRQVVNLVDCFHSEAVTLLNMCPLFFKLFHPNQVKYIGWTTQKETFECFKDQENYLLRRRPGDQGMFSREALSAKKQKFNEDINFVGKGSVCSSKSDVQAQKADGSDVNVVSARFVNSDTNEGHQSMYKNQGRSSSALLSDTAPQRLTSAREQLEEKKWYASPEELSEGVCTISSNIYSLGVLFFELLGRFDSGKAHAAAMSDLRHRILPPSFLSENPKEAGFCLWLLHPEPSSRPTTRDILQSEVINGLQEVFAEELSSSIEQDDTESELLMHFLRSLEEQKQNSLSKLTEDIRCLEADIEEVEKRHPLNNPLAHSSLPNDSTNSRERRHPTNQPSSSQAHLPLISEGNEMRLMKNISQLEKAYFSVRSKIELSETDAMLRPDLDLLSNRESWYLADRNEEIHSRGDSVGAFFEGLCKYARYSKFETRGVLRAGDFNNSANVICSLSFDRDEDYFAAAGVSKKIKIFEFNALLNDSVDIHYPVVEMSNRSKLSCVCWNNYIKNYLASADYDGVVKIWDANTGQTVSHYMEHEKRAWSVDFSQVHPSKLASGSDDFSVKLWSINDKNCLGTIRNIANVCCVQFSAHSSHLLAFGSADYKTYCFDLRNAKAPWCILSGHDKAVSYVKFVDSGTLVTASTDNTLKLWDLEKTTHNGLSTNACSQTFSGHTNEKNFVGLSVSDGYIACGSETNEVYAYYKSLPMPITSHKFGSIDPISGKDTDDDNGLFVSSVCWRGKSDTLIAANSSGCIKVLQMV